MKLLVNISLLLAIANAMVIHKNKDGIIIDMVNDPTPTLIEPTKIHHGKRAKSTVFTDNQNITIFEEGQSEWDPDWFESSWQVPEGEKVVDGIIVVDLPINAAFSLQSKTLESQYGYISFDYKLSVNDGNTYINFISFDDSDYVNQIKDLYDVSGYKHIDQEIKDHSKGTLIPIIKRFAWQNYGNENEFTLYLKNIYYRDINVEVKKYDKAIPVIDEENCGLYSNWKDISETQDRTSFEMINGQCVMKITSSLEKPAIYQFNKRFYGGKFEIVVKSETTGSILTWYALNSMDSDVEEMENSSYSMTNEYQSFANEDLDTENEYNALKIVSVEGEVTFQVIKFNFYPISADQSDLAYEVTILEEPDVIVDGEGLHWIDASWGNVSCEFQTISNALECTFQGKLGSWPGFAFKTENKYNAGTLVINMKVLHPEQSINLLLYDTNETYNNILTFRVTDEYEDYYFDLPSFENCPTYKYVLQEASQQDNIFYIRSILYYPPYIPLPKKKESTSTKKTTTTKKTKTATPTNNIKQTSEPDLVKTEEDDFQDLGYKICNSSTKISYADDTGIYGLEKNKWCAILEKNINSCWSILYGIPCCSDKATITGAWGKETDGKECGNPDSSACWAKEVGEYECCTRSESKILFVDESGAWGVKNNKWCGII